MEHLALLSIVLGIMMGLAAIVRSFSVYREFRERYLQYFALFTLLVWAGNTARLLISYLNVNTTIVSKGLSAVSTIAESLLTFTGVMFLVVSVRLIIKRPMRFLWWSYLGCAAALVTAVSYNAVSRATGMTPPPVLLFEMIQIVLFAIYLSIAVKVWQVSLGESRLRKIALRSLTLFIAVRPTLDFILNYSRKFALLSYYYFLTLQYLIEFLTYLIIFIFIRKFAMIISVPTPVPGGKVAINNDAAELYSISERELQVIELVVAGLSNQEISEKLFISIRTVKDHIYNIYKKTEVKNRVQLSNLFRK